MPGPLASHLEKDLRSRSDTDAFVYSSLQNPEQMPPEVKDMGYLLAHKKNNFFLSSDYFVKKFSLIVLPMSNPIVSVTARAAM